MRIIITILGILIVAAGVLPFLETLGITLGFLPTTSPGYQFVIIAVGILGLMYGAFNSLLFGTEKFAVISLGLLTILGGVLPFLQNYVPEFLPTSGPIYIALIFGIGVVGIIYGLVALG